MAYLMPLSLDSDPFIMASFQCDQISPLWQQKNKYLAILNTVYLIFGKILNLLWLILMLLGKFLLFQKAKY